MRIVFAGTPDFSVPPLRALIEAGHEVIAVYSQPDRPAGRGRKLKPSPVKQLALEQGLPVYQPDSLKTPEAGQVLRELAPDIMVVVAYGLILPETILAIPKHGCLNIHASLLPRWRGAAPIQRAIEAGDAETGVTIMQMDAGLDTGDMLLAQRCTITDADSAQSLHDKLSSLGADAIVEALDKLQNGQLQPQKQNDAESTYAAKLSKAEATIDWSQSALNIQRKIRALNPWPVAVSHWQGKRLRLWNAAVVADNKNSDVQADTITGTIICTDATGIEVQTGEGSLLLTELQAEGGKALAAKDFLNGNPMSPGQTLE
ncbi:MAG: methionyl-tRNA formyltransferase [Proteobacteria bacterium]|nr:methionyl-tRNA formyltransferase [Pseudomonadota bacterium]